jgi:hypothetical protein
MTEWRHGDFEAGTWFIPKENVKGSRGKKRQARTANGRRTICGAPARR